MRKAIEAALAARLEGLDVIIACVVEARGSAPRGRGACMAVWQGGQAGTVGGGPIEHACAVEAGRLLGDKRGGVRDFALTETAAASLGMVCGGEVTVAFWFVGQEDMAAGEVLARAAERHARGQPAWLVWRVSPEGVEVALGDAPSPEAAGVFSIPIEAAGTVYIFGGGHVAQALVPVLRMVDFRPVIFEDRPEFASGGILGDFADIGRFVQISARDYAAIMTRGHQADAAVLAQVLRTPAAYIGMIGSRRKLAATVEGLRAQGFGDADIARLHSPIGLDIGSDTPAEIAISIAAEMIRHRARGRE